MLSLLLLSSMMVCPPSQPAPEGPSATTQEASQEAPTGQGPLEPRTGRWHAWLDSPAGDIPFSLDLGRVPGGWVGYINNARERIKVEVTHQDRTLRVHLLPYDSWIEAELTQGGVRMDGTWTLDRGALGTRTMAFHASHGARPRFPGVDKTERGGTRLAGRWAMRFESSEDLAVGVFEESAHGVSGTVLTTLGDYRFLEGTWEGGVLRLSCFDGSHAFRFDGALDAEGNLTGTFQSGAHWSEVWAAWRDEDAALPDAFTLSRLHDERSLQGLEFPSSSGENTPLLIGGEEGRPHVVMLFGSWCPNCVDEARLLAQLAKTWEPRGVSFVGLGFEQGEDLEQQRARLKRFREALELPFPLLLGGSASKAAATESIGVLEAVRAFPTTLFVDAKGQVQAVHTGFNGPATGPLHERLVAGFELQLGQLLPPQRDK